MAKFLYATVTCLRFFSVVPLPSLPGEPLEVTGDDFARSFAATPIAGAVIGLPGAVCLVLLTALDLAPLPASIIAIAIIAALTGAMHEDGLADMADGLGGRSVAARLDIMRDSRMGAFGGAALVLAFLLRTALLASIITAGGAWAGAAALIVAHALARTGVLLPLNRLPPARTDGLGAAARIDDGILITALVLAAALSVIVLWSIIGFGAAVTAMPLALLAAWSVCVIARRAFGGQTGDVCGTAAIASETGALLAIAIMVAP